MELAKEQPVRVDGMAERPWPSARARESARIRSVGGASAAELGASAGMTGPPLEYDTHYMDMDMAHESTGRLRTFDDARAAHQHSVGGRANDPEASSLGGWPA